MKNSIFQTLCAACTALAVFVTAGAASARVSFEYLEPPVKGDWADFSLARDGLNMGCILGGSVYWWTAGGGFRFLDAGSPQMGGVGMSANGNALVAAKVGPGGTVPAIWYLDGTSINLGSLLDGCEKNHPGDGGFDVNADGTVAVGKALTCESDAGFHWSRRSGIQPLTPEPGIESRGSAVSADGRIVVGYVEHPAEGFRRPALWQAEEEPRFILGESSPGEALNISLSGQYVVGQAEMGTPGLQAFYWTEGEAPVALGNLSGKILDPSLARAVSDDGRVVGWSGDTLWDNQEAFIWTAQHGMQSLAVILESNGISLPDGMILTEALDISGDGTTVVGVCRDKDWKQGYWRILLADTADPAPIAQSPKIRTKKTDPREPDSLDVRQADMLNPFPFGRRRY